MTLAELLKLLADNPELANQLFASAEATAHFTKDGKVIKTQAEIDKAIADAKTAGDGDATKRNHEGWGKALTDILGIQKPDGVKELDFFPAEIKKRLEAAPKPNSTDNDVHASQIEQLNKKIETMEKASKDKEKQLFDRSKQATIDAHINNLNIAVPAHLKTNEDIEAYRLAQRNLIRMSMSGMKAEETTDGLLAFYGSDGKAMVDAASGKPLAVDAITKQLFGALLAPDSHRQNGTGGSGGQGGGGNYNVPFAEFQKRMAGEGKAVGSEEYNKEFTEYEKVNPSLL